jgi:hypothetical protein
MKRGLWVHLLLIVTVDGDGLKHMAAHGHDHKHKHGSKSEKSKGRPLMDDQNEPAATSRVHVDATPLFVKFHKTGSGTAANVFRRHCHEIIQRPELAGKFPWRGGPQCGPLPHEHATMQLYRTRGRAGFEWCTFNQTRVQLYTVLRDPMEKFFSGAYFWKKVTPHDRCFASLTLTLSHFLLSGLHYRTDTTAVFSPV